MKIKTLQAKKKDDQRWPTKPWKQQRRRRDAKKYLFITKSKKQGILLYSLVKNQHLQEISIRK